MPKNIVVLADGTARAGGEGHDTNVYKLFKMLENQSVLDRALWSRVRGVRPVYQPWILQQFAGRHRVEPWASGLEQPDDLDLWAA